MILPTNILKSDPAVSQLEAVKKAISWSWTVRR